ncbi:MAG: amidohydrolase family protein [Thermoleophilia bacterium]|nr:amidohydrolase family protein [Thermoleophilia bacterium]
MPSFDVHQHLLPEPLLRALRARRERPRLAGSRLQTGEGEFELDLRDHEVDRRLALLDRHEVDVALVSFPPTLGGDAAPELLDAWHTGARELVECSRGRLRALASGAPREGFAGVCIAGRTLVEGGRHVDRLCEALLETGGVLFVHPGPAAPRAGAPSWWGPVVDYTAEMQAAYGAWIARGATAFPELRVIFAILAGGAPVQLERLRSRGVEVRSTLHPNVFFDTASYGRRALELCLATYGVRQLVYGSDVPVVDPQPTLHALADFGDAVAEAVRKENPSLLLG